MTPETPDDWRLRAKCRDAEDPDLWCADRQNNEAPNRRLLRIERAKAVCSECPVKAECRADAGDDGYMVRGGLTPQERAALPQSRSTRKASMDRRRTDALHRQVHDLAARGWPREAIAAEAGIQPTSVARILRRARGAA